MLTKSKWTIGCFILLLTACGDGPLNNPYPNLNGETKTLYTSFSERPKHLDPARSYSSNEWIITNQIYEPPLQYHYLNRPYQLEPLVAAKMPSVRYYNAKDQEITADEPQQIAYSVYTIEIKPDILYQPHPAFAQNTKGEYLYHQLTEDQADECDSVSDFKQTGTRQLTADDFVYQIKRIADPRINSPIFGLMSEYFIGFEDFRAELEKYYQQQRDEEEAAHADLRAYDLKGVRVVNDKAYEITIKGHYPQLLYWLAMPFFAPMPWEAIAFYEQDVLVEKNITLDWYPIGTGPFLLAENNPNLQIRLVQNPNFHGEQYPTSLMPADEAEGLTKMAGVALPLLDEVRFILEKENIPYWNKFLQGYYDQSGISSDSFDQALQVNALGNFNLSDELKEKGIRLKTSVMPSTFYWGFNMLDDVVGGLSLQQKKLRQAISIAFDVEEFINIFQNGRGLVAQSLLPPGIFGFKEQSFNPVVYRKDDNPDGRTRRPLEDAKRLLAEAGYPGGIDPKTQQPLVLHLDAITGGGPDTHALYAWIRKQFKKLGIDLVVRATQYNRFQDKMRNGDAQIFSWGWNADYPDPENFLFLLYGPNSKVKTNGENAANYQNPRFDELFDKVKSMDNSPERQSILDEMLALIQEDAPWIWGYHPKLYSLSHDWMGPFKPNAMSRNTLKYLSVDSELRAEKRIAWNQPITWPVWVFLGVLLILLLPAIYQYWRKTHQKLKLESMADQPKGEA